MKRKKLFQACVALLVFGLGALAIEIYQVKTIMIDAAASDELAEYKLRYKTYDEIRNIELDARIKALENKPMLPISAFGIFFLLTVLAIGTAIIGLALIGLEAWLLHSAKQQEATAVAAARPPLVIPPTIGMKVFRA